MTSTIGAVALAIVSVLGLVMWILNRKNNATPEQKADDRRRELAVLHRRITLARKLGDDATAESLLRRLNELQNSQPNPPGSSPGTAGQRSDLDAATGNSADPS